MSLLCSPRLLSTLGVVGCLFFATYLYWVHLTPSTVHGLGFGHYITALNAFANVEVVEETGFWPYRVFQSSTWTSPNISIAYQGGDLAKGDLLLTPKSRDGDEIRQSAPFIISSDNELVYAFNSSHGVNDLRVQNINGSQHLTFFHGESVLGHGYGELIILDQEYQQTVVNLSQVDKLIRPRLPKGKHAPGKADFHELEITARDTALISAYNNTPFDLSSVGGSNDSWVVDSVFFEIDIASGDILFTWSALDHIPLNSSHLPIKSYMGDGSSAKPYDFFHLNSIQDLEPGYLINSRHTWSTYLLSKTTGHILWELSGSGSGGSFAPTPPRAHFRWQHHARAHNLTAHGFDLSLFDNHNMQDAPRTTASRALVLHIPLPPSKTHAPVLLRSLSPSEAFYAASQGSYDAALPNANQLVNYGPIPVIREFGPPSAHSPLLWEGRFGHDGHAQNYRASKSVWRGTPRDWDPALVVEKADAGNSSRAYVSWNGATEIERWIFYVGDDGENWGLVGWARKCGFETVVEVERGRGCLRVGAVRGGREIRVSNTVCMSVDDGE